MLTRLLDESHPEVAPVVWRSAAEKAAAPPRPTAAESGMAAVEQQIRQSYDAGVREGEALGRRKIEQQVEEVVGRLARAIAEVAGARAEVMGRAEADVVRLSIDIARRVLHRELSLDSAALGALVKAALEKLGTQEVYRARVHPKQAELVRRCLRELRENNQVEVVTDTSLAEGGVVFESAQGVLDASVETQLQEIERGLADTLGDRP